MTIKIFSLIVIEHVKIKTTLFMLIANISFKLLANEVSSNYISPVGLLDASFCLTDSSDPFDFSLLKTGLTGSAQRALSALKVFQLTSLSQKLILMV